MKYYGKTTTDFDKFRSEFNVVASYNQNGGSIKVYDVTSEEEIAKIDLHFRCDVGKMKINKLGTKKEFRGKGIATHLVALALIYAEENNILEVYVNPSADNFIIFQKLSLNQEQLEKFYKKFEYGKINNKIFFSTGWDMEWWNEKK